MKKMALVLLAALLLTGCAANSGGDQTAEAGYRRITQEEARRIMDEEEGFLIVDVRTQAEYEEGHIPGAICVPNESIGTDGVAELPDREQLLLVYCRSGRRSREAAQKLAAAGYGNVAEFGGIQTWTGEIEK